MTRSVVGVAFGCMVIAILIAMSNSVVFHGAGGAGMPTFLEALLLLMHGLAAIAGGYAAAAVARRRAASHGFAVGVLYLLVVQLAPVAVATVTRAPLVEPLWAKALAMAITVMGAVMGGAARGQARVARPGAPAE